MNRFIYGSVLKRETYRPECDASNHDSKLPLIDGQVLVNLVRAQRVGFSLCEPTHNNYIAGDFQEIGMVIHERYKIIEHLGEGMATVYLVQDQLLDEEVALKILHLEQVDGAYRDRIKVNSL